MKPTDTTRLLLTAIAACVVLAAPTVGYTEETLRVTSWGGAFQDAQRKVFFEPFEKATGIKIIEDTWQGKIGKIRAMVESNNITSDIFDANPADVITACDEGIAEQIDMSFLDDPDDFHEGALTECGVSTDIWVPPIWQTPPETLPEHVIWAAGETDCASLRYAGYEAFTGTKGEESTPTAPPP